MVGGTDDGCGGACCWAGADVGVVVEGAVGAVYGFGVDVALAQAGSRVPDSAALAGGGDVAYASILFWFPDLVFGTGVGRGRGRGRGTGADGGAEVESAIEAD